MTRDLVSSLRPALVLTALFFALTGLLYPLAITGLAQALFPAAANGSLVTKEGRVVGSALIGQGFAGPGYFHPRPSAAGKGWDATASAGSNLGPASRALADRIVADRKAAGIAPGTPIPADLLTTSGSGLDPDLSPAAARFQAPRIAAARHVAPARIEALIAAHTEVPFPAFLGGAHVNVLALNLALDKEGAGGADKAP